MSGVFAFARVAYFDDAGRLGRPTAACPTLTLADRSVLWDTFDMAHKHFTVQVGERGRFVLPAEVRRSIGVDTGDFLVLELDTEKATLHLRRAKDVANDGRGLFSDLSPGTDLASQLIEDRRAEAAREDAQGVVAQR
jgi:AbrB family looped-hinge helix DNA binding protein